MFESGYRVISCFAAILFIASGCSTGAEPSEEQQIDPTSPALSESSATPDDAQGMPAGAAGQGIGLERWEFGAGGVYGFDRNGVLVVEFHINRDDYSVESVLPEAGVYMRDGRDVFSTSTQPFYDALRLDLTATFGDSVPTENAASVQPSALVDCYLILANCGADALVLRLAGLSCTCAPDAACPL